MGLEDVDGFVTKCIQLYETTVVRHGLMMVGPTGSGKTRVSLWNIIYLNLIRGYLLARFQFKRLVEKSITFPLLQDSKCVNTRLKYAV